MGELPASGSHFRRVFCLFVFYLRIKRATNLSWKCYTFQLFSRVQCFLTPSAGPLPPCFRARRPAPRTGCLDISVLSETGGGSPHPHNPLSPSTNTRSIELMLQGRIMDRDTVAEGIRRVKNKNDPRRLEPRARGEAALPPG